MRPERIIATQETLEKIERACKRQFSDSNLSDECYLFVLDGMQADDYKRLRAFKGKSKLSTFLHTVIKTLILDFARWKFGRKRIPAFVERIGNWAITVYKLICWKKYSDTEAYELLRLDASYTTSFETFLQEIAPIKDAPCPQQIQFKSVSSAIQDIEDCPDEQANPLDLLLEQQNYEQRIIAAHVIRDVTASLPEKDQLLIKMHLGSDIPLSTAARSLGMSYGKARYRKEILVSLYKEKLFAKGIRTSTEAHSK